MKSVKVLLIAIIVVLGTCVSQAVMVLDFETEDDFITPLVNGQAIDTEFGNLVTISSIVIGSGAGHLGPAIFDSDTGGGNDYPGVQDPDLLVNLGNILIMQNNCEPTQTVSGIFDVPNDEADYEDRGAIIFDFISPVKMSSIDLIDINGGAHAVVTLTDINGKQRIYQAGPHWTTDITVAGNGWQTLDLTTLLPQPAEPGAGGDPAIVTFNDPEFNLLIVKQLMVAFIGQSPSGAMDNITFVPEPCTIALLTLGGLAAIRQRASNLR